MTHHPHVHMIVPGGGISLDGERWISSPARPSSCRCACSRKLFRRLFLDEARRRSTPPAGSPSSATTPASPTAAPSLRHLAPLRKKNWFVYAKPPFAGPEAVLAYLSRYTHRVAISNSRLIALDEAGVTFRYKDYRRDGRERYQTMTLAADEFIRRFLLHVLPKGFHRIRHYGLLASAARKANIARARELLAAPQPEPDAADERRRRRRTDLRPPCPCCGGRMIIIETFERGATPRYQPTAPTQHREHRHVMMTSALSRRRKAARRYRGPSTGDDEARSNCVRTDRTEPRSPPSDGSRRSTTARRSCSPASSIAALHRLGAPAHATPACPNRHRARDTP